MAQIIPPWLTPSAPAQPRAALWYGSIAQEAKIPPGTRARVWAVANLARWDARGRGDLRSGTGYLGVGRFTTYVDACYERSGTGPLIKAPETDSATTNFRNREAGVLRQALT